MQITQPKKKEALEFMMLQLYQHILLELTNKNKYENKQKPQLKPLER